MDLFRPKITILCMPTVLVPNERCPHTLCVRRKHISVVSVLTAKRTCVHASIHDIWKCVALCAAVASIHLIVCSGCACLLLCRLANSHSDACVHVWYIVNRLSPHIVFCRLPVNIYFRFLFNAWRFLRLRQNHTQTKHPTHTCIQTVRIGQEIHTHFFIKIISMCYIYIHKYMDYKMNISQGARAHAMYHVQHVQFVQIHSQTYEKRLVQMGMFESQARLYVTHKMVSCIVWMPVSYILPCSTRTFALQCCTA